MRDRIRQLLDYAGVGAAFVFGPLGDRAVWSSVMTGALGPAGAQYGVVTRPHLCALGLSSDAIDRRVASGRLLVCTVASTPSGTRS